MYYVEGHVNIIGVTNKNNTAVVEFNINSDWKGMYAEPIYVKLKNNLTDGFELKSKTDIMDYRSYNITSSYFRLQFSIEIFVSKCDCHFGIYFDIDEADNSFIVKRFDIIL